MAESLRQLRHVLALNEHRNYRRAAEALHLTQSALSVSIRRIEDDYGVPLFKRSQSGAVLWRARGMLTSPYSVGVTPLCLLLNSGTP